MKSSDGAEFRRLLKEVVRLHLTDEPVALLFSAGTDSLTVLWTLLELGATVHAYTFHLCSKVSMDARASAAACKHWGVLRTVVNDTPDVAGDVRQTIAMIRSSRKTHVEVMYAYWHLMRHVEEQNVWCGIQADTLYGSNKSAAIKCGKKGAEEFSAYRRSLLKSPDQEGLKQARMIASAHGKTLRAPYADPSLRSWFLQWSWKDLNRPKQKMPAILGFADRFAEIPIYRHDDNLQCGSGIREHMERIFNGRQRAAYNQFLEEANR